VTGSNSGGEGEEGDIKQKLSCGANYLKNGVGTMGRMGEGKSKTHQTGHEESRVNVEQKNKTDFPRVPRG
jgi:hypothetical protein